MIDWLFRLFLLSAEAAERVRREREMKRQAKIAESEKALREALAASEAAKKRFS